MKPIRINELLTVIALLLFVDPSRADEPADIDAQIEVLRAEREKVTEAYNTAIRDLRQSEELRQLDTAIDEAERAFREAQRSNTALDEARAAEAEAQAEFRRVVAERLAEHVEAKALMDEIAVLRDQINDHTYQVALARFQLDHEFSPVNRALGADPELIGLRERAETAAEADRAALVRELTQLREQKRAELDIAKPLLATVDESGAEVDRLVRVLRPLETKLTGIRSVIEKEEQGRLTDAREAVTQAMDAERLNELRAAHTAAVEAYNQRVDEMLADPELTALKARHEELGNQIRDLQRQRDAVPKP